MLWLWIALRMGFSLEMLEFSGTNPIFFFITSLSNQQTDQRSGLVLPTLLLICCAKSNLSSGHITFPSVKQVAS